MKLKMNLYLNGLKRVGERQIEVNDKLTLKKFCEYVIMSMNGNCKHLYQLVINEDYTYLCDKCYIQNIGYEEMMNDLTLEDINLQINDELMVNYDFRSDWEFILKITSIEEGYNDKEFSVITGKGVGILEDTYGINNLKNITKPKLNEFDKNWYKRVIPGYEEYLNKQFNIDTINEEIESKLETYYQKNTPKHYIMNVSLDGYTKEIKRKISVDSNINIDSFCRGIIASMKGDLYHSYGIKRGKEYLDEEIVSDQDLNYLELQEKQRLKVIYDFGDNWVFNITVSKINEGYGTEKRFKILSGKGYGIVDDCGGSYYLEDIFNGTSENFRKYDINEFDIEEIQKDVDIEI